MGARFGKVVQFWQTFKLLGIVGVIAMSHLITSSFLTLISLVASVLVLFYVLGYVAIAYVQKKQNTLRPDFKISLIFYLGIVILALGYLFEVLHLNDYFDAAYLISIILFVYGFEKRAGYAAQFRANLVKSGKAKKKK